MTGWDETAASGIDSLAYTAVVRTPATSAVQVFRGLTTFAAAPGFKVHGICRFYLNQASPDLDLYHPWELPVEEEAFDFAVKNYFSVL